MKTPKLNAALKAHKGESDLFKVTINADGGFMSHTQYAQTPNQVRGILRKHPLLAAGSRMVVRIKHSETDFTTGTEIFNGLPE